MTAALRQLLADARLKHIPKGQILLYEGDVPADVYIIKEGIVKLHSIDQHGNEKILHLLNRMSILPLAFFSGADVATQWYYTTLTECEVYTLPKQVLDELMEQDWPTAKLLMNSFSEEVHEVLLRLDSLGKTNIDTKLSIALRYLAVRHATEKRKGWYRVDFPVNHQLLADIIGMSRESTAIAMKALADKKIVYYSRAACLEIYLGRLEAYIEASV
jgi:CRP-like cAMP-binding protein